MERSSVTNLRWRRQRNPSVEISLCQKNRWVILVRGRNTRVSRDGRGSLSIWSNKDTNKLTRTEGFIRHSDYCRSKGREKIDVLSCDTDRTSCVSFLLPANVFITRKICSPSYCICVQERGNHRTLIGRYEGNGIHI